MLDIKLFREQPDKVRNALKRRGRSPQLVDDFLAVDGNWRSFMKELEDVRAQQNLLTKDRKIEEAKVLKEKVKSLETGLKELEVKREEFLNNFPNIPADDVPVGKNEKENIVLREVGQKPKFGFEPKDYLTIAEKLDVVDVKNAAEISGSRFGFLKGKAALLELALVHFGMKKLIQKGFLPVLPPIMIKPEIYKKIGRLAADQKEERYFIEKDNIYLVGTAEHTLVPLEMNKTLNDKDLPKRYAGFSTCFRREAGSYGKDTKGILRVHQFDKLEMVCFTRPEDSEEEHQSLLSIQEELMQELKLPYRVVQICTGDIGWTDYKQYDIEAWLPGQNEYRETHSCSNTTDFQTRGISCKYKKGGYVHCLNATAIAIQRMIIAIIENYQTKEGDFEIPEVLKIRI
jgi:seryl-tRNA synthetase